jgi:hypothetical protein
MDCLWLEGSLPFDFLETITLKIQGDVTTAVYSPVLENASRLELGEVSADWRHCVKMGKEDYPVGNWVTDLLYPSRSRIAHIYSTGSAIPWHRP